MTRQATSVDYYHLIQEFQPLIDSRIDKIFQDDSLFLFQLYTGKQRTNLVINIPDVMYMTNNKPNFPPAKGFASFLRKRLQKAKLQNIEQVGFDRIIKLTIDHLDGMYHVYIELFGKGNLVVCDDQDKIISTYKSITYSSRAVRGGQTYALPPQSVNTPEVSEEEFSALFGDKPAVVVLAADLGLGGLYAQYIVDKLGIDKNDTSPDTKELYEEVKLLFSQAAPQKTETEAYPILYTEGATSTETFSQALAALYDPTFGEKRRGAEVSSTKKVQNKYEKIVEKQTARIEQLQGKQAEDQRAAELLYENYQEVKELLEQAQKDRKELSEQDFVTKYSEHPLVEKASKQELTLNFE